MGSTKQQINPKAFAESLIGGATLAHAAVRAGYSESTAKRGWAGVSEECKDKYIQVRNEKLAELAQNAHKFTPEQRAAIIRGKLLQNIAEGKDESVGSVKLLGQDKELSLWQPESMVGVIILDAPKSLPPLDSAEDAPLLPAEVTQQLEEK